MSLRGGPEFAVAAAAVNVLPRGARTHTARNRGTAMTASSARFRDRNITFANGSVGQTSTSPPPTPAITTRPSAEPRTWPASLSTASFPAARQSDSAALPLVIVTPGSLGVAGSHLAHAETLTNVGIAAFVLDPFGARGIGSTVANQTQFSFAASAYDALAAWKLLPDSRGRWQSIGAQGHSRGGSAVLSAATRRFADPALGAGNGLKAVLAAYPWSGHQFLDPVVGYTEVRILMGDRDEWCSPMQVQGHVQAIRLAGGKTTYGLRRRRPQLRRGSHPARPRGVGLAGRTHQLPRRRRRLPSAQEPQSQTGRSRFMVYALKAGYGSKGETIGTRGDEANLFRADM